MAKVDRTFFFEGERCTMLSTIDEDFIPEFRARALASGDPFYVEYQASERGKMAFQYHFDTCEVYAMIVED